MDDPYTPPAASLEAAAVADGEAEAIRREHVQHEASIRSIGGLFMLAGTFGLFAAAMMGLASITSVFHSETGPSETGLVGLLFGLYGVLAGAQFWAGRGLRRYEPRARVPAMLLSVILLISFPAGTLIGGYGLYLLGSAKGMRVLSPDYAEIVRVTPHVKVRTSAAAWGCLAVLVLALGLVIIRALL